MDEWEMRVGKRDKQKEREDREDGKMERERWEKGNKKNRKQGIERQCSKDANHPPALLHTEG
jgi:hypothetical protein